MRYSVRLSVLVLVVFGVQRGYCIECYSCSSKDNEACIKPDKSKIPLRKCDSVEADTTKNHAEGIDRKFSQLFHLDLSNHDPLLPMNCLKQVTKVGDQEIILRGCQLAPAEQLDICVKVKKVDSNTVYTKYCSLCNTDGCNTGVLKKPLAIVAVLPLLARFLLY